MYTFCARLKGAHIIPLGFEASPHDTLIRVGTATRAPEGLIFLGYVMFTSHTYDVHTNLVVYERGRGAGFEPASSVPNDTCSAN